MPFSFASYFVASTKRQGQRHFKINNDSLQLWLFCDYPVLFAFYYVGEIRYNWNKIRAAEFNAQNKDLLIFAQGVVKTGNVIISRCYFAEDSTELLQKCVSHVQHDSFSSLDQSNSYFMAIWLSLLPAMRKLPFSWSMTKRLKSVCFPRKEARILRLSYEKLQCRQLFEKPAERCKRVRTLYSACTKGATRVTRERQEICRWWRGCVCGSNPRERTITCLQASFFFYLWSRVSRALHQKPNDLLYRVLYLKPFSM